jgi:hypothetical protein
LHKGLLLHILAIFIPIDHKNVVEALARAEVLSPREHCLHWHRLAILTNRHIGKGNLTFTSIGLCGTIYHLILALASHDLHQGVILIVQFVEVLIKVGLYIDENNKDNLLFLANSLCNFFTQGYWWVH